MAARRARVWRGPFPTAQGRPQSPRPAGWCWRASERNFRAAARILTACLRTLPSGRSGSTPTARSSCETALRCGSGSGPRGAGGAAGGTGPGGGEGGPDGGGLAGGDRRGWEPHGEIAASRKALGRCRTGGTDRDGAAAGLPAGGSSDAKMGCSLSFPDRDGSQVISRRRRLIRMHFRFGNGPQRQGRGRLPQIGGRFSALFPNEFKDCDGTLTSLVLVRIQVPQPATPTTRL